METQSNIPFKVENIVAMALFKSPERIDLTKFARRYVNVEYDPERFPGIIYRSKKNGGTCLIFSTAKMVITGIRLQEKCMPLINEVLAMAREANISMEFESVSVNNMVATASLGHEISLNAAVVSLEEAMYEPEVFPGLIYKIKDPKVTMLLFTNGRVVITGANKIEDISRAITRLALDIKSNNLDVEEDADIFV